MPQAYDLPVDVEWPSEVDKDWRDLPEPEGEEYDDDEEHPAPQYVIDVLGVDPDDLFPPTTNVFCPTGKGGGVDPTCSPDKGGGFGGRSGGVATREEVVADLAKQSMSRGMNSQSAKSYHNRIGGRAYAKLLKSPWQTADQLTAKDRQGKRDVRQTADALHEMQKLGHVQIGYDTDGMPHYAPMKVKKPKFILDNPNDKKAAKNPEIEERRSKIQKEISRLKSLPDSDNRFIKRRIEAEEKRLQSLPSD